MLRENPGFVGAADETGSGGTQPATSGVVTTSGAVTTSGVSSQPTSTGDVTATAGSDTTVAVSEVGTSSVGETTGVPVTGTETGTSTGETSGDTGATGTTTGEPGELPPEATLCGKPGPWVLSEPTALGMPVNVSAGDLDMWLGVGDTTLAWSSLRDGKQDSYRAARPSKGAPFDDQYFANNADVGLSTSGEDGKLTSSKQEGRAYLSARLQGDPFFRIHTGDLKNETYAPLTALTLDVPNYPHAHDPHISVDDRRLYFAPAGDPGQILVVATRPGDDQPFAAPSGDPFVNLHDPRRGEADPTLPAHELVLIYTRKGEFEDGGNELWVAGRSASDLPFVSPQPLPGVNTPGHDGNAHITRDGCELFFARSTVQDPSAWDIYRSEIQ